MHCVHYDRDVFGLLVSETVLLHSVCGTRGENLNRDTLVDALAEVVVMEALVVVGHIIADLLDTLVVDLLADLYLLIQIDTIYVRFWNHFHATRILMLPVIVNTLKDVRLGRGATTCYTLFVVGPISCLVFLILRLHTPQVFSLLSGIY